MAALASIRKMRVLTCARCGRKQTADRMVFSSFSRLHYCSDIDRCAKRARRKPLGRSMT